LKRYGSKHNYNKTPCLSVQSRRARSGGFDENRISSLGTARWTTAEATDSGRAREGQGQVELVPPAACLDSMVHLRSFRIDGRRNVERDTCIVLK
jgi:hypothetical protein